MSATPFSGRATGFTQSVDVAELRRALAILPDPEHHVFLQALPGAQFTIQKAAKIDALVEWVQDHSDQKGLYWCLNPLPLLSKAPRVGDVLRRRWLLMDFDAFRPANTNSTAAEHERAKTLSEMVRDDLCELGWPRPVEIDSGNGWHLLYSIDLPNDEPSRLLLKSVLAKVAECWTLEGAELDVKVHDARRISKLPGTWARKGPHSEERPHRLCRLASIPLEIEIVSRAQLEQATGMVAGSAETVVDVPAPAAPSAPAASPFSGRSTDDRQSYARAALERECGRVAMAPEGSRNDTLNKAAFAVGQLVAAGALGEAEARSELARAAARAGLLEGVAATISSGLEAGKCQPRQIPERNGKAPPAAPAEPSDSALITRFLTDIQPEPVRWLVPGILPLGKLTLLAGEGGHGKSSILLDIGARLTTGRPCCGLEASEETAEPCNILLIGCEDDTADTIVPRLVSAGADLPRVEEVLGLSVRAADGKTRTIPFSLSHVEELGAKLAACPEIKLVIIDPVSAFVGRTGADDHKDSELRTLLAPLTELAGRYHVAIVLVAHLNKSSGSRAVNRVLGSAAYVNAVRAAWLVTPSEEDEKIRVLMPFKSNISPDRRGYSYSLEDVPFDTALSLLDRFTHLDGEDRGRLAGQLYRVKWHGRVSGDVNAMLSAGSQPKKEKDDGSQVAGCARWIKAALSEYAFPDREVEEKAKELGYSKWSYREAKSHLKEVDEFRSKPFGAGKEWWVGFGNPNNWTLRPLGVSLAGLDVVDGLFGVGGNENGASTLETDEQEDSEIQSCGENSSPPDTKKTIKTRKNHKTEMVTETPWTTPCATLDDDEEDDEEEEIT